MTLLLKSMREEIEFIFKKVSLMILFFIGMPVLTLWFAGAYAHEYVNDIPIAVLDEDNSSLSRQIAKYFDDNERFKIEYYASNREELERLIHLKKANMGVYLPPHLSEKVLRGEGSQVLILTDGANVVIGNNAYAGAAEIIQTVAAGTEIKMIEAKGSLPNKTATSMTLPFTFTDRMLYDSKLTYMNYLIYGFMTVFFQQLMLSGLATLIFRNPKQTAGDHPFTRLMAKVIVAAALLMLTGSLAIYMINRKYGVIFAGDIKLALLMSSLFAVAISAVAILLCALTKDKIKFSQVSYMLSLPTFLACGYVWPVEQMPSLLVKIVKLIWPLIYFSRPFDEIMVKGLAFEAIRQNAISLVLYSIVFMPLTLWVFKKRFTTDEITKCNEDTSILIRGEVNL
ncbi:hypothetical protein CS063_13285 [Sporanaerobium hydrogeniformans]|uniref:Uncharacterized protein n=1 Tax=Sporanaerobium hydrogeniformans TaxID=3072179 RepID=A0AC61D9K8_9FIRM|nr:ABC transporter permease [Sporanaerobium hydrogeniformans]PHV69949.1 hypothetical protein CS063_13285 [Sporanaerobium hydrogeniformans]